VRVDRLEAREADRGVERSAMVSFDGDELRVWIAVPPELDAGEADASPFVPAALLPAMCRGEDLEVDGPVSPAMLRGAERAAELYASWSPGLRPAAVRAAEEREPPRRSEAVGCFFSRGVDSTYSAAVPRRHPGPLERLVFCDGLEPRHDERVRAEEIRLAGEAAADLSQPLSVVATNLRELTHPVVRDWEDMAGAGLAFVATSLAGGLGHVVIPSTDGPATLGPVGISPLLDPLFSTEAVRVHHDSVAVGRVAKAIWLARERPELLRRLKVCFVENRPDNCGRCSKCLLTMTSLAAAEALDRAEQFPDEVDLDAVRGMRLGTLQGRADWAEATRALDPERHGELREAILERLRQPPTPSDAPLPESTPGFRRRNAAVQIALLREGRPWPPPAGEPTAVGLVRAVDARHRRHVYGAGSIPAGELVGELGSMPARGGDGLVPLRMTPEGYVVAGDRPPPAGPRAPRAARLRWALAPLAWRGDPSGPGARVRAALLRSATLAAGRAPAASAPAGGPLGHLHPDDAPGRLALHSAIHPHTGDQLLTTDRWEAVDLGYGEPVLLGYLDADAPVTGRLGTARPHLPLASRFGRRVRGAGGG
jgi:hypothetical protein